MNEREVVGNSVDLQRIKDALQELSVQNRQGTFAVPHEIQSIDYGRDSFLHSFTQFLKTSGNQLGASSNISPSTSLSLSSQYCSENEIDDERENNSMTPNELSLSLPASFDEVVTQVSRDPFCSDVSLKLKLCRLQMGSRNYN